MVSAAFQQIDPKAVELRLARQIEAQSPRKSPRGAEELRKVGERRVALRQIVERSVAGVAGIAMVAATSAGRPRRPGERVDRMGERRQATAGRRDRPRRAMSRRANASALPPVRRTAPRASAWTGADSAASLALCARELQCACHLFAALACAPPLIPLHAAPPSQRSSPTAAEKPLLDIKADPKTGKIIATLPKPDADGVAGRYIYLTQLETGLGSAPIGLDRAAPSELAHPRLPPDRQEGRGRDREPASSSPRAAIRDEQKGGARRLRNFDHLDGRRRRQHARTARSRSTSPASSPATTSACPQAIKSGGGGDSNLSPELSAADPNFVKVFPQQCRVRGAG